MQDEMENLLRELQNMKKEQKNVPNNQATWSSIGQGNWSELGFESEEELKDWLLSNPYGNLIQ